MVTPVRNDPARRCANKRTLPKRAIVERAPVVEVIHHRRRQDDTKDFLQSQQRRRPLDRINLVNEPKRRCIRKLKHLRRKRRIARNDFGHRSRRNVRIFHRLLRFNHRMRQRRKLIDLPDKPHHRIEADARFPGSRAVTARRLKLRPLDADNFRKQVLFVLRGFLRAAVVSQPMPREHRPTPPASAAPACPTSLRAG